MRALDRYTIEALGVSAELLMESAGRALVDFILEFAGDLLRLPNAEVVIVCGPGNNGGDGFVAARHLALLGIPTRALLLGDPASMGEQAAANHRRARLVGVVVESAWPLERPLPRRGVVVDALYGTGLSRPIRGDSAEIIQCINALAGVPEVAVIAVDLPSGLDADTGQPLEHAVVADATLTLGTPKIGLALEPGRSLAGRVSAAGIGIAESIPSEEAAEGTGAAGLWSRCRASGALPERNPDGHKGNFGHVLVVGGAKGMSGAAALAANAALRSGAGLVTVGCPAGLNDVLEAQCTEAMTAALPETREGGLAETGVEAALALAAERDVVALGPGVGRSPQTGEFVRELALCVGVPLVVDADGLNAFGDAPAALRARPASTILTPHPGEAGCLLGTSSAEVNRDRVGAARELARVAGAVVLLKGAGTVAASPDGRVIINPTGGPNLATAGSGDVLTGLVAALVAQGLVALEAAALGAFVHGMAGDRIALRRGDAGLLAGELAEELPRAMQELREEGRESAGTKGYRLSTLLPFPGP
jgi:NAD(P)H-hydrate epimerase